MLVLGLFLVILLRGRRKPGSVRFMLPKGLFWDRLLLGAVVFWLEGEEHLGMEGLATFGERAIRDGFFFFFFFWAAEAY